MSDGKFAFSCTIFTANMNTDEYEDIRRLKEARKNIQHRQQDSEGKFPSRNNHLQLTIFSLDLTIATRDEPPAPVRSKNPRSLVGQYTATAGMMEEVIANDDFDPLADRKDKMAIASRESEYQKRKYNRTLDDNGDEDLSYEKAMELRQLEREEREVQELIRKKNTQFNTEPDAHRKRSRESPERSTPEQTKRSRWDVKADAPAPVSKPRRSRWDQVPVPESEPSPQPASEQAQPALTDEFLDSILPSDGYEIVEPPVNYTPLSTSNRWTVPAESDGFVMLEDTSARGLAMSKPLPTEIPGVGDLQYFKENDMKYFGKLLDEEKDTYLSVEDLKERKVMRLLLKIKNGTPPVRKAALRQITDHAREFGPKVLFNQILPLLMEHSLEDQERHLLVKVIDRVLYKLGDLVRPYTHKILVVIEPLLIDEDYFARIEGREIISNLSKAAGLAHMIATMRPDIDHADEFVRNTTARSFAVVASALGIPALIPFIKAVCRSKKSWEARHTGIKIVQQIAVFSGCGVLPHLTGLVECIAGGLSDEQNKVRMIAAMALSSLAEAASPYGIESFDPVLEPLWRGIRHHRGKNLAAFLRCIGCVIPLMEPEHANYYTREVMFILLREYGTSDDEMKKVVLKVTQQCSATEGVTPAYLRSEVLPPFFKNFWVRRIALDRRSYKLVVETTMELARKVGVSEILERVVGVLKDDAESYRKMGVETVDKVVGELGVADIGERLEIRLVDGILTAFQEQTVEDVVLLNGFGTTVTALGGRTKPYIPQIVSAILFRLNHQNPAVRQQSADLITKIAVVMKQCNEDALLGKLGSILYEQLGEEYPEVLGSILGALGSIVNVIGLSSMQPPIRDLLPRLTPILRNRHEKVQENTIDLVGRIADRGAEYVSSREWMRICFELLDLLKAHRKGIRRAANNTFGYIAKAIGPQDVLATLLSNLRVQERQSRVCTAVAIGIVAETCAPFTVLPALMNEYRVPEMNVQNGVLKSLTFMFEYIGDMAKDYVYAVTTLLEDALIDRDQVHRQTAATVVKHLALGCVGLGYEDAMIHLLDLLFPNIFETSPHVIDRILDGVEGIRNAAGTGPVMNYVWAGLFHAARKVRTPYWRIYNSAYVQSADALVPYYPEIPEEQYHRHELDLWI